MYSSSRGKFARCLYVVPGRRIHRVWVGKKVLNLLCAALEELSRLLIYGLCERVKSYFRVEEWLKSAAEALKEEGLTKVCGNLERLRGGIN